MAKGQSHLHCWASGVLLSAFVTQPPGSCRAPEHRLLNPQLQPWLRLLVQSENPPTLRHMDRETTRRCCLKDPQGSATPNCHRKPQVGLHSPVLQHRGDGQGVLGARGSSSFLKLPWGRCVWGEGRRPSPAGPGSCGAAPGGHSPAYPCSRAGAPGRTAQPCQGIWGGWDGHPKCAATPSLPPCHRGPGSACVQQGWSHPGAAHPALLCLPRLQLPLRQEGKWPQGQHWPPPGH